MDIVTALNNFYLYTVTPCGEHLTRDSGVIQSPNYPLQYYHNADCEWTIEVSEGVIEVLVTNIDIEDHSSCDYDSLEVIIYICYLHLFSFSYVV